MSSNLLNLIPVVMNFLSKNKGHMSENEIRKLIHEVLQENSSSTEDRLVTQNLMQLLEQCIGSQQAELKLVAQEKDAYKSQVDDLSRKVEALMKEKESASAEPDINTVVKKQLLGILEDFKEARIRSHQHASHQPPEDKLPWSSDFGPPPFDGRRQQREHRDTFNKFEQNRYGQHSYETRNPYGPSYETRNPYRPVEDFEVVNHEDCYSERSSMYQYPQFPNDGFRFPPPGGDHLKHSDRFAGNHNTGKSQSRNQNENQFHGSRTDAQFKDRMVGSYRGRQMHNQFRNRDIIEPSVGSRDVASRPGVQFKVEGERQQYAGKQGYKVYNPEIRNRPEAGKLEQVSGRGHIVPDFRRGRPGPQNRGNFQCNQNRQQNKGDGYSKYVTASDFHRGSPQNRAGFHRNQNRQQTKGDSDKREEDPMKNLPAEKMKVLEQLFLQYKKDKEELLKQSAVNQEPAKPGFKKKRKPRNKQINFKNIKGNEDGNDSESDNENGAVGIESVVDDANNGSVKKPNEIQPSAPPPPPPPVAESVKASEKMTSAQLELFVASDFDQSVAAALNPACPLDNVMLIAKKPEGGIESFAPKNVKELVEFKSKYPNAKALLVK